MHLALTTAIPPNGL